MTTILESIILGIVQGITEWLPISSSGHLAITKQLFGISQPIVWDVVLHLGSLLVIVLVFWKDIRRLVVGVVQGKKSSLKLALQLIIATIPIAIVGLVFNDWIKSLFQSLRTVGYSLLFTSLILLLSRFPKVKTKSLNYKNTVVMGLMQAIAILPGVSRSGMTISTGLMQGVKREEAATFSFLMFIPAILGASLLEIGDVANVTDVGNLTIATIAVIVSGYISLKWLLKVIKHGDFNKFGWYCLVLGLFVLIFTFI